jgi:hypothetical protein
MFFLWTVEGWVQKRPKLMAEKFSNSGGCYFQFGFFSMVSACASVVSYDGTNWQYSPLSLKIYI